MHGIYELKDKLMKALEEYGGKEMSAGSLEVIDKLAHAIKNICKIIDAAEEEEYSQRGGGNYAYDGGGSYRGGRYSRNMPDGAYRGGQGGNSYARGRGRNARRDSMGRYSGASGAELAEQIEDLMQDAPNDQIRQQMQQLVSQIEQM